MTTTEQAYLTIPGQLMPNQPGMLAARITASGPATRIRRIAPGTLTLQHGNGAQTDLA